MGLKKGWSDSQQNKTIEVRVRDEAFTLPPEKEALAYYQFLEEEKVFRICSIREINEAKKCNPGSENPKSVWNKSPNEMMRLVPLRKLAKELMVEKESDFLEEDNAPQYSDNVVPFVPSLNYSAQSVPDYDYNHDYEGYPS